MSILNKNSTYALLLNYSKLYANTTECTPQLYNTTYHSRYGVYPQGGSTYQNSSQTTPYKLNFNISNTGPSIYLGIFSSVSHISFTTGKAAEFVVNTATNTMTSVKIEGLFQGLNYTQIHSIYANAVSLNNACGIMV
jgi:hypothetical protein